MIQLTHIRLINWHNFQDAIIEFNNITYLIGVNAVGKTTILDALRYCLTTNKNFNTAGNRKSKRTLQGSVHDKQREENVYLRPGHTVSYIGTEFFNTENNTTFVIIARVESESPNEELHHISQDWYISKPGVCLKDMKFLDVQNNTPTTKVQFESIGTKRLHQT
jgi:predicted ATP-dependent endonuclease of OLD family